MEVDDNEARFSKLLYIALKQLGEQYHIGGHKSEFTPRDSDIKKADFSEDAQVKEAEDLAKKKKQKEAEIQNKASATHQAILKAQNDYAIACQATIVPNNTFSVKDRKFFVETHDNYYIVPENKGIVYFEYKIHKRKLLADVLKEEAKDRSIDKQIERLQGQLALMEQSATKNFINKSKPLSGDLKKKIKDKKEEIGDLEKSRTEAKSDLENLASATTIEDKRKQLEFIKDKLNDPQYKHIKNIKKSGGEVKIYLPNDLVNQYDYKRNPIKIEKAKELYNSFSKNIKDDILLTDDIYILLTVFLASLLAEPSRSSVAHITNMLLLNEKSELSKASELPKQVDNKSADVKDRIQDNLYEHTSMTQPGSDPSGNRTKDYPYDLRLQQGEDNKATNINVSNRDLAAIKHNREVKDKLLEHFKKNKSQADSVLIEHFRKTIEIYLDL